MEREVILRVRTGDEVCLDTGRRENSEQTEETINDPVDFRERRTPRRNSA